MNLIKMDSDTTDHPSSPWQARSLAVFEIGLIVLLFFVFAGTPTPGDDEAHYLGKAKQYFNPDWLAGDFFLGSRDAHLVFNWTLGWLTLFFSLPAVAWIGRFTAWTLLAWSWRRLSLSIIPRSFASLLTVGLFLVFQDYGNVAREWIVRGIEAKCFAYVFLLLGLEMLVRRRWRAVWPLLGLAATFHVLVGGWAVIAAAMTWAVSRDRLSLLKMWPWVLLGGLFSLPGLVPGLLLSAGAKPEILKQANDIYVYQRLSHHLLAGTFAWDRVVRFHAMIFAWGATWALIRRQTQGTPLWQFVAASLVIATIGVVIDQSTLHHPEIAASLLKYYWYRLADVMVPVGLSMALVEGLHLLSRPGVWGKRAGPAWLAVALVPMLVLSVRAYQGLGDHRSGADRQGKVTLEQYDHWLAVCDWVQQQTPEDAVFLPPPSVTTLRWHAQRSEVVGWKDIPQDAPSIVQWSQRLQRVRRFWGTISQDGLTPAAEQQLQAMVNDFGLTHVIVDVGRFPQFSSSDPNIRSVQLLHQTSWHSPEGYAVYRIVSK